MTLKLFEWHCGYHYKPVKITFLFLKYDKAMFTEIDRIAQINYARKEGKAEGKAEERERIIKALRESGVSEEVIAKAVAAEPAQ